MSMTFNKYLICLGIIFISVAPAFALGHGNMNYLLVVVMGISPLLIIINPILIPRVSFPLITICLMMIFFPLIFHPLTMRWSTVFYTCMFCCYFIAYCSLLYSSNFERSDLLKVLRILIYAYCFVLLIQQFCVLTGLPIFNVSNYDPKDPWKLNSLMSEPSQSGRIIPILMCVYVCLKQEGTIKHNLKTELRSDRGIWIAFMWSILTMGSATAFLFLAIVLSKFIKWYKMLIFVIIIFIGSLLMHNKTLERVFNFSAAVITFNEKKMIKVDDSAAWRVVPFFRALKKVDIISLNDWFGYGIDADTRLIESLQKTVTGGGGALSTWLNFGFIVQMFVWVTTFLLSYSRKNKVSILIWFFTLFLYGGLNNQIVWCGIIIQFTYKYILNKKNENNTYSSWAS